jgi:hypothetical protein
VTAATTSAAPASVVVPKEYFPAVSPGSRSSTYSDDVSSVGTGIFHTSDFRMIDISPSSTLSIDADDSIHSQQSRSRALGEHSHLHEPQSAAKRVSTSL